MYNTFVCVLWLASKRTKTGEGSESVDPFTFLIREHIQVRKDKENQIMVTCLHPLGSIKLGSFVRNSCSDGVKNCAENFVTRKSVALPTKSIAYSTFLLLSP